MTWKNEITCTYTINPLQLYMATIQWDRAEIALNCLNDRRKIVFLYELSIRTELQIDKTIALT